MAYMGDFGRDRRGGGRDFKRRDFGSGSSDRPQVMHQTICSNCGKECEVPFRPNGSKPVYCRDCFQTMRPQESQRSENFPRRSNFEDRNNNPAPRPITQPQQPNYREQFDALNAKLDKILNLLSPKNLPVKKVEVSEPTQVPEVEIPIIKKKKPSKK